MALCPGELCIKKIKKMWAYVFIIPNNGTELIYFSILSVPINKMVA
jgi:hypothetical protein